MKGQKQQNQHFIYSLDFEISTSCANHGNIQQRFSQNHPWICENPDQELSLTHRPW
jgi:hypothetical protein